MQRREPVRRDPVRRGAPPVEESGRRQDESAGADRRDGGASAPSGGNRLEDLGRWRPIRILGSGDHDDVGRCGFREGV